jgi:hypothetical protein
MSIIFKKIIRFTKKQAEYKLCVSLPLQLLFKRFFTFIYIYKLPCIKTVRLHIKCPLYPDMNNKWNLMIDFNRPPQFKISQKFIHGIMTNDDMNDDVSP